MCKKVLKVAGVVGLLVLCGAVVNYDVIFAIDEPVEEEESSNNTVQSSASATASVTVSSACSFTVARGSGYDQNTGTYSTTLANGATATVQGSTFTTACNDPGGYAIYAIGYSNNALGNTDLIFNNTPNSPNNIQTNGSGSHWGMSLSSTVAGKPIIESGFGDSDNPHTIPSTYTKIASYNNTTAGINTSANQEELLGQAVTVTYSATASNTQPAGTYTGAVKYTMVYPNTNIPNQPRNCSINKICYFPNAGNTVTDTMGDQSDIDASSTSATLWASNFQRPGYGFAGWSDAYDYVVNEGSESNSSAHIYGPNETISFEAGQFSNSSTGGLSLYAVWVPVATDAQNNELTFQTSNLLTTTLIDGSTLSSKNNGYVTALRDKRDGQVYAVAKLEDGKYWMIENLRLESAYTTGDYYRSLAQGYGTSATYGNFIGLASTETNNFNNGAVANSIYYSGTQSGTAFVDIGTTNNPGYRIPRYNNFNTNSTIQSMTDTDQNVYSYGNYYNWPAAIANTTYYDSNNSSVTTTSICPSGWRLPKGGQPAVNTTADFYVLTKTITGMEPNDPSDGYLRYSGTVDGVNVGRLASNALRSYPNNFIYPGTFESSSIGDRDSLGGYWSSSVNDSTHAYYLGLYGGVVYPGNFIYGGKYSGFSVRCVAGS